MCLLCFVQNTYQVSLRDMAQFQSDRFEHTLEVYKKIFIGHFYDCKNTPVCSEHKAYKNLHNRLSKIEIDTIKKVFDALILIYTSWLDGQPLEALSDLKSLFETHFLFEYKEDITETILFRGRYSKPLLSHWDMFHIPFNKRFLIKNQRYSLGGQPILYFSYSPYGVLKELNVNFNNATALNSSLKELKITSFYFKESDKTEKRIKPVYDFRNTLDAISFKDTLNAEIVDSKYDDIFSFEVLDLFDNQANFMTEELLQQKVQSAFIKLIVSSSCTFKASNKPDNAFFVEEYVLPQLVAQIIKDKFDGIIYTSSKRNDMLFKEDILNTFLQKSSDNIALFTHYDKSKADDVSYVYDKDLYTKFNIASPILLDCILQPLDLKEIINDFNDFKTNWCKHMVAIQSAQGMYILNSLPAPEYLASYYSSYVGKLHLIMLCNILASFKHNYLYKKLG